ncbi:MAG: protein kinase domain-containing protein [Planctomycetota bacterium]
MANNKDREPDASIGDQNTFQGQAKPKLDDRETRSLGDQVTFGGGADQEHFDDDGMEIVDLAARYKIEKTLGKGGMGEVLLATDTRLNRKVAIKRILGDAARSKTSVNRFLTEAKSIAALNHPNVFQIYDYGRAQDGPFLIMEFVDGSSLLDRCREGALPLDEAVDLACQLCDGLGRAHDVGIIHRDIKPANVRMTADGIPKLTDFGLAKAESADTGMTMAGAVLGTLDFMPPEQRRDAALTDARSDLWSLAATLYQMVTGKSPKIIKFNDIPKDLQDVLDKALQDSKDDRYQSARELKEALRDSLNSARRPVPKPTADLGAGECPSCHTINESHRKFCRECGDPLRCKCLKCEHEIPVWDRVCPECGGKQAELVSSRMEEIHGLRQSAEQKKEDHQYQEALDIAQCIATIDDRRLNQQQSWAIEFLESTKTEWDRQKTLATQHLEEAKKHHAAFDYQAAIQSLEAIPPLIRSPEANEFLRNVTAEHEESKQLITTIKTRIRERKIDGLLQLVEKAILLRGDREDLGKLKQQLHERGNRLEQERQLDRERDHAFSLAEYLLLEGKANEAYQAIAMIDPRRIDGRQSQLRAKLEQLVAAEKEIATMVKDAKRDGVIDLREMTALYPKVNDYLQLQNNSWHDGINKLRNELLILLNRVSVGELIGLSPQSLSALPDEIRDKIRKPLINSISMKLKLIPAGKFTMGEESDAHEATLTKPFYLGIYAVNQEEYQRVMGTNPSKFKGARNPVENVSWNDQQLHRHEAGAD